MSSISIQLRASLQFLLLIAVVYGIGYYLNSKQNSSSQIAEEEVVEYTFLHISGSPANSYPDMKFGSDKAWNNYHTSTVLSSQDVYEGKGTIGNKDVEIEFILNPDGTMVGRYHHANGTKLDLNGYIDSKTNDLKIHLGHGSELSTWTLSPDLYNSSVGQYVYTGTWGRKKRPSELTINIK